MWLNVFIFFIQFMQLGVYPLRSAFELTQIQESETFDYCFRIVPLSFGIFEIIIHFNISYYDHGATIINRGLIFWKYTTNKFLFDIVCLLLI